MKLFNNIFESKIKNEQKVEKEIKPQLNILLFDDDKDSLNPYQLKFYFSKGKQLPNGQAETIEQIDQLNESAVKNKTDLIIVFSQFEKTKNELIGQLLQIRNNPDIKKQPLVLFAKRDRDNYKNTKEIREEMAKSGHNISMQKLPGAFKEDKYLEEINKHFDNIIGFGPGVDLEEMKEISESIPRLIGYFEDQYGDKMMKNKLSFYREYKDKLADRSEVTADTDKELEILEKIFQENNVKKVLDAGGGAGRIAIPLSENGYSMTNIDSSNDLLEKMKEKTDKVTGVQADLRKLPLKDGEFDAVTYNWHVFCDILGNKSKQVVLNEAYRVLKNNGVITLDLPDREKGDYKKDGVYINYPGGEAVFVGYIPTEKEVTKYLEEADFKEVTVKKWETKSGFPKISFMAKKN